MKNRTQMNILFVDDDSLILAGLERKFRRFRGHWKMEFVTSGAEALQRLSRHSFDVVVTDLSMPVMSGGDLLWQVKERYPRILRLILSSETSQEATYRTLGPAHQFLTKPCDPGALHDILNRGIALQTRLANPKIQKLVNSISLLPSLPRIFFDVVAGATCSQASVEAVGAIIAQDAVLNSNLLQLANSPYFATPQRVTSATELGNLLGLDMLKSLALCVGVFNQFKQEAVSGFSLDQMIQHSIEVGQLAKQVARSIVADDNLAQDAMLAGMLHDVGKLALATSKETCYTDVLQLAHQNNVTLWHAEKGILEVTHADVGSFLLNLWGLPQTVVEAVALHHEPAAFGSTKFSALTAVHVANGVIHERTPKWLEGTSGRIDDHYLSSLDHKLKVSQWIAQELQLEPELIEANE